MREIKFRAWDRHENKLHSWERLLNMRYNERWFVDNADKEYINCLFTDDGYTLEQFTGLKDKNGVEIYEGDILRFPAKDQWEEKNFSAFEVFFHDNDCADNHVGFQMNRMHNYGAIAGGFCGHKFLPKTTAKTNIIGNIHQNPELLK